MTVRETWYEHLPPIPLLVPTVLGTAISLLLSFKLNQSYDRWWEARKIWGAIVNDSRSLVRKMLTFPKQSHPLALQIARRQIAWCYCLGQTLRSSEWTEGQQAVPPDEVRAAKLQANPPLYLLQRSAADLRELHDARQLDVFERISVDDTLTRLCDSMGMAERIKHTVFPVTYRLFLHFSIYLFLMVLVVALDSDIHLWAIVLAPLVAIPFFLLEETASHLQDPFDNLPTDTPVTAIARTIEINILQLLGEEAPPPRKSQTFYLM